MNDHDKALAVFESGGWAKKKYTDGNGGHCVMGCYRDVVFTELEDRRRQMEETGFGLAKPIGTPFGSFQNRYAENYREFVEAIGRLDMVATYMDTRLNHVVLTEFDKLSGVIADWNDHLAQHPDEVREAFKRASENHELAKEHDAEG